MSNGTEERCIPVMIPLTSELVEFKERIAKALNELDANSSRIIKETSPYLGSEILRFAIGASVMSCLSIIASSGHTSPDINVGNLYLDDSMWDIGHEQLVDLVTFHDNVSTVKQYETTSILLDTAMIIGGSMMPIIYLTLQRLFYRLINAPVLLKVDHVITDFDLYLNDFSTIALGDLIYVNVTMEIY